MLVEGLTGGMGAGKTTVSACFAKYDIPIIDADVIARHLTQPDQPALTHIVQHFGKTVLNDDDTLNRAGLRDLIFNKPDERRWLEDLLHPSILGEIKRILREIDAPYCIIVIPLLLEIGPLDFIDRILVIDTPKSIQIERVIARDKLDKKTAEAILTTQVDRPKRLATAHDIIQNDGDLNHLAAEVNQLHQTYLALSKKG